MNSNWNRRYIDKHDELSGYSRIFDIDVPSKTDDKERLAHLYISGE